MGVACPKMDVGGGSSGEKGPTALNRSWEFCARTKTEGKRALLRALQKSLAQGAKLRTPDSQTTEVAAPEHT